MIEIIFYIMIVWLNFLIIDLPVFFNVLSIVKIM